MRMIDLIAKKRDGKTLTAEEFDFIAQGAAKGTVPDYQLSAFLMACFLRPLSDKETALLTKAMAHSGGHTPRAAWATGFPWRWPRWWRVRV